MNRGERGPVGRCSSRQVLLSSRRNSRRAPEKSFGVGMRAPLSLFPFFAVFLYGLLSTSIPATSKAVIVVTIGRFAGDRCAASSTLYNPFFRQSIPLCGSSFFVTAGRATKRCFGGLFFVRYSEVRFALLSRPRFGNCAVSVLRPLAISVNGHSRLFSVKEAPCLLVHRSFYTELFVAIQEPAEC